MIKTPKQEVIAAYPSALCMHVPMSMAVAIYCDGKRVGNAAVDADRAWESAARCLRHNEQLKPPRVSAVGLEAPVGREDGNHDRG